MSTQTITPEFRARVISAFDYFNPYRLLDGERCNPWAALLEDYRRAFARHDEKTKRGFLHWLCSEAAESHYCKIHGC